MMKRPFRIALGILSQILAILMVIGTGWEYMPASGFVTMYMIYSEVGSSKEVPVYQKT